MIAIGDELTVTVGSGGSVALSAYGDWVSDQSSGSQTCYTRWYKWNGSAYVAIGTETASEAYVPSGGLPASWGCNYTDTGNTASSTQKYRLYGRAGGSYTASISGSCSAVAS